MTGPVTTEALVEALTQFLLDRSGETLWQCEARAKAIIAGPLAPLLAAKEAAEARAAQLQAENKELQTQLDALVQEVLGG